MVYRRIFFRRDKCRRVTIRKHGSKSFTVNLGGKAMYEAGSRVHAKELAIGLKLDEKIRCGAKLTKKEAKWDSGILR